MNLNEQYKWLESQKALLLQKLEIDFAKVVEIESQLEELRQRLDEHPVLAARRNAGGKRAP